MSDSPETPQIYLITPPGAASHEFPDLLASCLDRVPVACVRLSLPGQDPDEIASAADRCRAITDARDVALVLETHIGLAERLGLDGVHLADGARSVAAARKALGDEAIIGAFCGNSRHEGMNAGERGADYISFGPLADRGLGDGRIAAPDLFAWWSQMVELPVVAEGALEEAMLAELAAKTDFLALGEEIWRSADPAAELARIMALLQGA